jgi:hypothetical protein
VYLDTGKRQFLADTVEKVGLCGARVEYEQE